MRLRKRAYPEQVAAPIADPYDRPSPVFVGFEEGQTAWIGALYEFNTASGDRVYLGAMECVDMQYRPFSRQFVLTFESVGSEFMPESTVVLTFDDAEIYSWQTDFEGTDWTADEPRTRGQVGGFDCMVSGPRTRTTGVSFHLSLVDVGIDFFASRVTCDLRAGNA